MVGLALPVKTMKSGRLELDIVRACYMYLAGEEGFEPSHAGIKIRCLNQLGDSPTNFLTSAAVGVQLTRYKQI